MRALLIEDHAPLSEELSLRLREAGFTSDIVESVEGAKAALSVGVFDIILLDLGLVDGEGLSLISWVRGRQVRTPILVLTARDSVADRVRGLDAGADDYLSKPFATEELLSRMRALLRRPGQLLGALLSFVDIEFDTVQRQVTIAGAPACLSHGEMIVLERLMRAAGRVVTKDALGEDLYGFRDAPTSNSIEVFIHRVRKRLEAADSAVVIHTLRGVGYMLTEVSHARPSGEASLA